MVYGQDPKGSDDISSTNNVFKAFIPTPKPRRRRKLFPSKENRNTSEQDDDKKIELEYYQDPHVSFVVKAVSALTAAFRLVQLEQCVHELEGIISRH